jgi:hypothetical protein
MTTTTKKKKKKKKKKKRNLSEDSDSDGERRQAALKAGVENAWPRFFVVRSMDADKPIGNMSPFLIQKWFAGVSTTGFTIKKLRNGDLLIECATRKASDLLRKRDGAVCVDRKISVSVHQQLKASSNFKRSIQKILVPGLAL